MTGDIEKIYSNDYADFLINYSGDLSVLEPYRESGINIINFFYAVVHLPSSTLTEDVMSKMGYSAIPSLFGMISEASLEASGILRVRSIPNFDLRGKGVLIGIADSGIDYTNPVFQYADKTSRIAGIWDQTIISDKIPAGMAYGTEYTREQINEALKSDNPFSIVPTKDENGHGTMVAGIAAGNEVPESGFYGVAPEAELIITKLKPAKQNLKQFFRLPENAVAYQENDLIFGIQYLLNYAAQVNKPIVICVTVDTSQYAHDGRGSTSSWLSLQSVFPGVITLFSVGNEGNAKRHYMGSVKEDKGYDTVELNVGQNETGFSMELWGTAPNIFSIDITSPSGEYIPRIDIRFNETREITFVFDPTEIYVDNQIIESQSGDQLILLRFTKPTQGIWKFRVYSRGIYPISFHIWLPMNHFITEDTYFVRPDPYTTLLSTSCASVPITVTAYKTEDDSLYIDAGRGYTRIDYIKPDIAAPGVNILSPAPDHGFSLVTGSSAAAAHTAGVAAMLLEWGIVNGNYPKMSTQDMKIFMIRGARRKVGVQYPNRDWGYGILDIYNVFDSIRSSVQ
jgi:subtilisin family serine protease